MRLQDLVQVTLVYDPALSPADAQPLDGRTVAVPPDLIPLPSRGVLLGRPGFSRQAGPGQWEWVLTSDTDPLDAFVDSLTGTGGWLVPTSRATVKQLTQALLNRGFTRAQVAANMPALYNAVAVEVRAETGV